MDPIQLIAALEHSNVRAFLWMLRHGEGTQAEDGYRIVFGGRRFVGKDGIIGTLDDFADHPRGAITATLAGKPITSTAAGAYQFLSRTWDGLVKQYGFADFSPKNQDLGAVALIKGRKALDDVIAGRFEAAVMKCNKEWASLPGSPYGQPVVTMAEARREYEQAGGTYAAAPAATPQLLALADFVAGDTILPPIQQEAPMAPALALALPALIDLVPKLGGLFASGSETSQRNLKAAEVVVAAAKEAIGAVNEQQLAELVQNDPDSAKAVRTAIEAKWFEIMEVGGGIQAARAANDKYLQPGAPGFWLNPAFWLSLMLLAMPYTLLVDMFFVHPESYSGDLRTQVITAVLVVITIVGAYWLGTSASSQRKTDAALAGK
jgi:muramidase (phage lysozyme)